MGVYNQIIDANGGNKFKLPHFGKQRLEQIGELPTVLDASDMAVELLSG